MFELQASGRYWPVLNDWLSRAHGSLMFRVTQVLSEHGCFGKFLYRIGRDPDARCHHCIQWREDTVRYTLAECFACDEARCTLLSGVGEDRCWT